MTQIDCAAVTPISLAIVGSAILASELSRTDTTMPTIRVRIAQYRCGNGTPSSAEFIGVALARITRSLPSPHPSPLLFPHASVRGLGWASEGEQLRID